MAIETESTSMCGRQSGLENMESKIRPANQFLAGKVKPRRMHESCLYRGTLPSLTTSKLLRAARRTNSHV